MVSHHFHLRSCEFIWSIHTGPHHFKWIVGQNIVSLNQIRFEAIKTTIHWIDVLTKYNRFGSISGKENLNFENVISHFVTNYFNSTSKTKITLNFNVPQMFLFTQTKTLLQRYTLLEWMNIRFEICSILYSDSLRLLLDSSKVSKDLQTTKSWNDEILNVCSETLCFDESFHLIFVYLFYQMFIECIWLSVW